MVGWGGENLDQSLRTQPAPSTLRMTNMFLGRRSWLCGGEIMMAKDIVGTQRFSLFSCLLLQTGLIDLSSEFFTLKTLTQSSAMSAM